VIHFAKTIFTHGTFSSKLFFFRQQSVRHLFQIVGIVVGARLKILQLLNMEKPEIVLTNRGKPMLVYQGYTYYKHSENRNKTKTYWVCTLKPECRKYAQTTNEPFEIWKFTNHEHAPSPPEKVNAKKTYADQKRKATEDPYAAPAQLLRGVPKDDLPYLPLRKSMKRTLNKRRAQNYPSEPKSLLDAGHIP